jgi:hypothetical protein
MNRRNYSSLTRSLPLCYSLSAGTTSRRGGEGVGSRHVLIWAVEMVGWGLDAWLGMRKVKDAALTGLTLRWRIRLTESTGCSPAGRVFTWAPAYGPSALGLFACQREGFSVALSRSKKGGFSVLKIKTMVIKKCCVHCTLRL